MKKDLADMIEENIKTDFKTMKRTGDSKGRFKNRESMKKYIEDVETASIRDSAKVKKAMGGRIGYKMGSKGCGKAKSGKGRAYGKNS